EQVLLRAMSKSPDNRYAFGHEFAEAFRNALNISGVLLGNASSSSLSMTTSTSGRLIAQRGLFDPSWQKGSTGSVPVPLNDLSAGPAGVSSVVRLDTPSSTGILSRTGKFPKVSGTG